MAETKTSIRMPGGELKNGYEVPQLESIERWSELKLEDGALIRLKPVVSSVIRLENEFDQEGNPVYVVKSTVALVAATVPENLRKKS